MAAQHHGDQADMDALLQQLDRWAEGEGDLPTEDSEEAVSHQQKKALWVLLNQPITSQATLQQSGPVLR